MSERSLVVMLRNVKNDLHYINAQSYNLVDVICGPSPSSAEKDSKLPGLYGTVREIITLIEAIKGNLDLLDLRIAADEPEQEENYNYDPYTKGR